MTVIDTTTATWSQIKRFCESERESLVEQLIDGSDHDDLVRGEIRFIDRLLKHENRPPKAPPPSHVSYTK